VASDGGYFISFVLEMMMGEERLQRYVANKVSGSEERIELRPDNERQRRANSKIENTMSGSEERIEVRYDDERLQR
jgi:hypothetical protein